MTLLAYNENKGDQSISSSHLMCYTPLGTQIRASTALFNCFQAEKMFSAVPSHLSELKKFGEGRGEAVD